MKVQLTASACVLTREQGDKRISHETTVAFKMKQLLNAQGFHFTRMNPSKHGLTSCTIGLWDKKAKIILWHERYAIESAAFAFNNHKSVTFQRDVLRFL